MMSTSVNTSATAPAKASQAADGAQAVQAAQALPAGEQPAGNAAPSAASPFKQWLGQQAEGTQTAALPAAFAALAQAMQLAAPDQAPAAQQAGTPAVAADETKPSADGDDGTTQDTPLLAAMAMPLMPLTPMQIAQAVQIAQTGNGSANGSGSGSSSSSGTAADAAGETGKAAAMGQAPVAGVNAAVQDSTRRTDAALPQLAQLPLQTAPAAQTARPDDSAVRFAVQAAAGHAGSSAAANGNPAGTDAVSPQDGKAASSTAAPAVGVAVAAAPAASQPAADTVKLAGPPTAWRQSLQEALGDRLQLQVGKNMEQAVIRLEPPQLGRIDIAIRHSNGTLEVNISASNGEVLRQLQAVGDNLRNDLAQRQYTEVAVSVTATPKSSAASPFADPQQQQQQQQGRGRQPGRDQEEPGRALAEASNATSAFSLGGREAG